MIVFPPDDSGISAAGPDTESEVPTPTARIRHGRTPGGGHLASFPHSHHHATQSDIVTELINWIRAYAAGAIPNFDQTQNGHTPKPPKQPPPPLQLTDTAFLGTSSRVNYAQSHPNLTPIPTRRPHP